MGMYKCSLYIVTPPQRLQPRGALPCNPFQRLQPRVWFLAVWIFWGVLKFVQIPQEKCLSLDYNVLENHYFCYKVSKQMSFFQSGPAKNSVTLVQKKVKNMIK